LPQPEGPIIAVTLFLGIEIVISSRAFTSPKNAESFSALIISSNRFAFSSCNDNNF